MWDAGQYRSMRPSTAHPRGDHTGQTIPSWDTHWHSVFGRLRSGLCAGVACGPSVSQPGSVSLVDRVRPSCHSTPPPRSRSNATRSLTAVPRFSRFRLRPFSLSSSSPSPSSARKRINLSYVWNSRSSGISSGQSS